MLDKVVGVYQEVDHRVIIELTEGEIELDLINALELHEYLSDLLQDSFCRGCSCPCGGDEECYRDTD